jgi:hypothetical protein
MKIAPWHAADQDVFHDNTKCEAGAAIAREDRLKGNAKRTRCEVCAELGTTSNFSPRQGSQTGHPSGRTSDHNRSYNVQAGTARFNRRSGNR